MQAQAVSMKLAVFTATVGLAALTGEYGVAEGTTLNDTKLPVDAFAQQTAPCQCLRWTPWINADQTSSDGGDFETIGYNVRYEGGWPGRVTRYLARKGIVCNTPARVECRETRSQRPWFYAGDNTTPRSRINCDSEGGFVCRDSQQADGRCHDYEIRLLCWTECERLKWTAWSDRDNPSGYCDCEHPGGNAPACIDGGTPMEVDCRTTSGVHAALAPNQAITCSVDDGFSCWNADQPGGTGCLDYKVRYLCGNPGP